MTASKELMKELDADWLEDILIYAMRYTLGRSSYSPGVSMDFIRPLIPHLTDKALTVMIQDVRERLDSESYGGLPYVREWSAFCANLEAEKADRIWKPRVV